MATIPKDFGSGGSGVPPAGSATPSLKDILFDIADDLADGKAATIASPDATDLATAITLVNEIKAALNAVDAKTVRTQKGT